MSCDDLKKKFSTEMNDIPSERTRRNDLGEFDFSAFDNFIKYKEGSSLSAENANVPSYGEGSKQNTDNTIPPQLIPSAVPPTFYIREQSFTVFNNFGSTWIVWSDGLAPEVDNTNSFSGGLNAYVIPEDGLYFMSAYASLGSPPVQMDITMFNNGVGFSSSRGEGIGVGVSGIVSASAGDLIKVAIRNINSGPASFTLSSATYFFGYKIQ